MTLDSATIKTIAEATDRHIRKLVQPVVDELARRNDELSARIDELESRVAEAVESAKLVKILEDAIDE